MDEKEKKILAFWKEKHIFQKSLEKDSPKGEFVFYEGPPTANGKPGIHHLEARAFKDIIPRYKTMQGFRVPRKAGWDTHGLPVELQVEKALGLKSKKEIETYGIAEFNKKCKESVWEYVDIWRKFTERMAYWTDMEHPYVTYENPYIESVWNILKTVSDKKLLYKDYKVLPWCPRCGTALSSHELAQGYQDDKDLAVTVKFKVVGQESTYILAWTTTPWTLPGNVALAVGEKIEYVKVKIENEFLILAKARLVVLEKECEIVEEFSGKDLLGLEYEPLYPFLQQKFEKKDPEGFAKAYKVYPADFVTTEDGTGVVHTAVMYGQDDFVLGTKVGLPKFHLVNEDGHFQDGMGFLSGRFVKDEEVAVDIIKDLAHRELLFKKEKYEHSYPHCWRCKTPLIYYARDSWYIAMSKLRDELVKENEGIHWEPAYIKEGRFGEWLRDIKDWAISRERYWGTPLPFWMDTEGKVKVIGSIDELKKHVKTNKNKFIFIRHGESENNINDCLNCDLDTEFHLTKKGEEEAAKVAKQIKKADAVYVSPYLRAKETANIIAKNLKFDSEKIQEDKRLSELDFGDLNGKKFSEYLQYEEKNIFTYDMKFPNGESYNDAKRRTADFLYEIDAKHSGKTVVVVAHGMQLEAAMAVIEGADLRRSKEIMDSYTPETGKVFEFDFVPLPHNENYELDLHRPFIDSVELVDERGGKLTRVKEVLDVWFDSGSMPFAQNHFPFSGEPLRYPADFISEAIDQTRGWFYTLHAIGILMGRGKAYKNVICLGHILDDKGKKMSKSLGNIVDPWTAMEKFGADALRLWMYSVNQPGDSKNFDEKTVDELVKKVWNPLENILAFYELYADDSVTSSADSGHVLDRWILSRLSELVSSGTTHLDEYRIFEASRLIRDFVGDFSTWYLRRSRERFKSDEAGEKRAALQTTKFVLAQLAKYLAPFTPFLAEILWQKLKGENDAESVHLADWPKARDVDQKLLQEMELARDVVTKALELRQKAGQKVRQPLASLTVLEKFSDELLSIIKDEINVKEIREGKELALDVNLTDELVEEGNVREAIRAVQDWRKEKNLKPGEKAVYPVPTEQKDFFRKHAETIQKATNTEF